MLTMAAAALFWASGVPAASDPNPEVLCLTPRPNPTSQFPGLPIGFDYYKDPKRIPRSAHCGEPARDYCEFIDRFGILNHFTDVQAGSQDIFLKEAVRTRGGPLPYGVKWSDSYREVQRKLVREAPRSDGRTITAFGCYPNPIADGFWTIFTFDRRGRLVRVRQLVQAY